MPIFVRQVVYAENESHLRVWYGNALGLHSGPASHTRGNVCVASSWAWVSSSLLQWHLPPGELRPRRIGPLALRSAELSPVPHPVGSRAAWLAGRYGGHDVGETASRVVGVRFWPLAARISVHSHCEWREGSGVGRRWKGQRWRVRPSSINVTWASLR